MTLPRWVRLLPVLALAAYAVSVGAGLSCSPRLKGVSDTGLILAVVLAGVWGLGLWLCVGSASALGAWVLAAGVFWFGAYWLSLAGSRFGINGFDGALWLLAHLYAAKGRLPYRDFSALYPPGSVLALGAGFRPTSPQGVLGLFAAGVLAISLLNGLLLYRITRPTSRPLAIGLYLGAAGLTVGMKLSGSDPFSVHLLATAVLFAVSHLTVPSRLNLTGIAASVFLLTWLRWDWPAGFLILSVGVASLLLILRRGPLGARAAWQVVGAQVLGGALAVGVLAAWLLAHGVARRGWDFIVNIPVRVIGPYRWLPLTPLRTVHQPELLLWLPLATALIGCAVVLLLAWRSEKARETLDPLLLLVLAPLSLLPFAMGRSDIGHFLPMLCLTLLCVAALAGQVRRPGWVMGVAVGLGLSALPWAGSPHHGLEGCGQFEQSLVSAWGTCAAPLSGIPHPSLYLGRTSYQHFIVNYPVLYLAPGAGPPASTYLSDEPGLQNSCKYGARVAGELARAPKPMLVLLTQDRGGSEPNASQSMESCGEIERFLSGQPFEPMGVCAAVGGPYEVRLYTR